MIWYVIIEREVQKHGVQSLTFKEKANSLVHAVSLAGEQFAQLFGYRPLPTEVVEAGRWLGDEQ